MVDLIEAMGTIRCVAKFIACCKIILYRDVVDRSTAAFADLLFVVPTMNVTLRPNSLEQYSNRASSLTAQ